MQDIKQNETTSSDAPVLAAEITLTNPVINNPAMSDEQAPEIAPEPQLDEGVSLFNPVRHLIDLLTQAGHPNPTAWTKDLDPRAETAPDEKDRIFFANRAIRLFMSEHTDRENITPRMLLPEGVHPSKWAAVAEQGMVKWFMGHFEKKPEAPVAVEEQTIDSQDVATNVFDKDLQLKEVVVAGGTELPAGVNPEDFHQSVDAAQKVDFSTVPAIPQQFEPSPHVEDYSETPVATEAPTDAPAAE